MPVSDQLIDQLLADYKSPEDLLGEQMQQSQRHDRQVLPRPQK